MALGNVGAGIANVGAGIAVGTPKSKKKVKKKPVFAYDPLAPLAPSMLSQLANQMATATVQPALRALERSGQTQTENLGHFTRAISEALAGAAPALTQAYQGASQAGGAFGEAFGRTSEQLTGNPNAAKFFGAVSGVDSTALGSYGATALADQKAQSRFALDKGTLLQGQLQAQINEKRKELLDQITQKRSELMDSLQERELKKISIKASLEELGLDKERFKAAESQRAIENAQWEKNFKFTKDQYRDQIALERAKGNEVNEQMTAATGYLWGNTGPVLDENGQMIPVAVAPGWNPDTTDAKAAKKEKAQARKEMLEDIDSTAVTIIGDISPRFADQYENAYKEVPQSRRGKASNAEALAAWRRGVTEAAAAAGDDEAAQRAASQKYIAENPKPPKEIDVIFWEMPDGSEVIADTPPEGVLTKVVVTNRIKVTRPKYRALRKEVFNLVRARLGRYKGKVNFNEVTDKIMRTWFDPGVAQAQEQGVAAAQAHKNALEKFF